MIKDICVVVFRLLFPPQEAFETRLFYGWRNLLAGTVLFLGGVMTGFIALAFGLISVFGFNGFAHAGDVSELKKSQFELTRSVQMASNDIMAIVVGGQVFELRTRQCAAAKGGNVDLYTAYSSELNNKMELYRRVSQRDYQLQACP